MAQLMKLEPKEILTPGKYPQRVKARSLLCYWGVRELGMTTVAMAKKINLAQPTVSQAVLKGQKIAEDLGLSFRDQLNQ
jgi:putative transposase